MDPKDTGFFQKNIEKLVLGLSVALLLGTAYYFVMGSPFTVEINGQEVKPSEIKPDFERRVASLERKLNDEDSDLPDREIPPYAEAFKEAMAQSPTTMETLTPLAQAGLGPKVVPPEGDPPRYDLPRPPIAEEILTRKGHAVLSDDIRTLEMEGLIKLIGNEQPRDFQYVSVSATFDMDEWIKRLQSGDKETRVPARWWNSMIGVAGVYLQRQELDEATGEWGNEVLVDPIPGQTAFKHSMVFEATNQQAKEAIQFIRTNQEQIVRPDFPRTRGNIIWSPPNKDSQELDAEGQRKLARINGQITNYKEQIERLIETVAKEAEAAARREAAGQPDRTRRTPPATRGGRGAARGAEYGGGGGYDEGGGGRAPRTRATPRGADRQTDAPQTPQERINFLQQQLIDAKIERDKLLGIQSDVISRSGYTGYGAEGEGGYGGGMGMGGYGGYGEGVGGYGGYGEGMDGYGGYGGQGMGGYGGGGGYGAMDPYGGGYGGYGQQPGGYAQPGTEGAEPESRKIQVWAHDLSIEPGKTYRYRVVVAVLNPLYRQKRIAEQQRAEHYDRIALGPDPQELASSPWSEPVRVDSKYYFFMVKGSTQAARVEVWRIHDGKWVSEEFEVRPGDPIGRQVQATMANGREIQLDLNVGKVVVDLISTGSGGFGGSDLRMLYLDPEDNRITERSIESDRNNPDRIRLQNEQALEAELALSAGTGDPSTGRY